MNIQSILDEFDKREYGRVCDLGPIKKSEQRTFLKQSLEQAYKQGVNDSIDSIEKGKEMGWNAGEIVQDLEDKKAKLLKE